MSLKDDINIIINAIKDRRSQSIMAHDLNKENKKEQQEETLVNSITNEMMNLFSMAEEKAQESRIELNGMRIEPKKVNGNIANTYKDPRVLFEAMKLDDNFSRSFDTRSMTNEKGNEQYVITKKKFKPDDFSYNPHSDDFEE